MIYSEDTRSWDHREQQVLKGPMKGFFPAERSFFTGRTNAFRRDLITCEAGRRRRAEANQLEDVGINNGRSSR